MILGGGGLFTLFPFPHGKNCLLLGYFADSVLVSVARNSRVYSLHRVHHMYREQGKASVVKKPQNVSIFHYMCVS
jgi:hypothetical protein